jgi:TrmH family RNA methyltransferase
VRGGMGAHFNLNIFTDTPLRLLNNHTKIGGFQEGEPIDEIDTTSIEPWVLVIGNEANGISAENAELINQKITIPKIGKGESLNAAVAGSVLLYHLTAPS